VVGEECGPVRPSTIVVPNIFRDHYTQMPLIEDQYAVGEYGSDRTHEPFSETVHPRLSSQSKIGSAVGPG
jgi:hypothetical protein